MLYNVLKKSSISLARTSEMKNSTVAYGFSLLKINYFHYLKGYFKQINEVCEFSIKYRSIDILLEKT